MEDYSREKLWEVEAGETLKLLLKVARTSKNTSQDSEASAVASKDDDVDSSETADWGVAVLRKMTSFTVADLASAIAEAQGPVAQAQFLKMVDCFQQKPSCLVVKAWKKSMLFVLQAAELIKIHEKLRSARKIEVDDVDEEAADKLYVNVPKPKKGSTPEEIAFVRKRKLTLAADFINLRSEMRRLCDGLEMMDRLVTAKLHLIEVFEQSLSPH